MWPQITIRNFDFQIPTGNWHYKFRVFFLILLGIILSLQQKTRLRTHGTGLLAQPTKGKSSQGYIKI